MNKTDKHHEAISFLQEIKDRIASVPRIDIEAWPNWPALSSFPIEAPQDLSRYEFTVMKDTFPDGRIRVAIQCYRHRFLGFGSMFADGFVLQPDGSRYDLTEQDIWDVT